MHFAFLIDPPESLHIEKDTSFALMLECQAQGHGVWILERGGISLQCGQLYAVVRSARVADDPQQPFVLSKPEKKALDFFDVLLIRTDPPFDAAYLTDTWLLSQVRGRPIVLNNPAGMRHISEKIWAAQFTEITPATLITADKAMFLEFASRYPKIVIKPTDGFGGEAVFVLESTNSNLSVAFETLKMRSGYVVVQEYLPAAEKGDKRILLLRGEILGAVLRRHSANDHRNNFAAGGTPHQTEITAAEHAICAELKPHLLKHGIFLAGVDVIGEKLIEVNVTSPTCLREMQRFYPENLAAKIVAAAIEEAERVRD